MQIKCASKGERQTKQDNVIKNIKRRAMNIRINKYFSVKLSKNFSDEDGLFKFIKEKAYLDDECALYDFQGNESSHAIIRFYTPSGLTLKHLTLGSYGDLNSLDITGEIKLQLSKALKNAIGAFGIETSLMVINLVVMEFSQDEGIDFCEALFGTEFYTEDLYGRKRWSRSDDGLFNRAEFTKIFGVIGLIKKQRNSLASDYLYVFLINPTHKGKLSSVNLSRLFPDIKVIFHDTYIQKNFGI